MRFKGILWVNTVFMYYVKISFCSVGLKNMLLGKFIFIMMTINFDIHYIRQTLHFYTCCKHFYVNHIDRNVINSVSREYN